MRITLVTLLLGLGIGLPAFAQSPNGDPYTPTNPTNEVGGIGRTNSNGGFNSTTLILRSQMSSNRDLDQVVREQQRNLDRNTEDFLRRRHQLLQNPEGSTNRQTPETNSR